MTGSSLIAAYARYQQSPDIDRLLDAVRRYAQSLSGDDDVAQQVVIRVWRDLPKYDPGRGNFAGWVRVLTQSIEYTHVTRRPRIQRMTQQVEADFLADLAGDVDPATRRTPGKLRELLMRSPEPEFITLCLSGVAPRQAARTLGWSENTFRYKLRCLKKFVAGSPEIACR